MRIVLNKLIALATLLFSTPYYSQSTKDIAKPTLWIKQKNITHEKKIDTSLYFNFNPKYRSTKITSDDYRNILSNRFSLFIVFKSEAKEEANLATLNYGEEIIKISNTKLESNKNHDYKKVNPKDGILLSYFGSTEKKGKKKLNLLHFENLKNKINNSSGHDLIEFLYYPNIISPLERKRIESYLSIKYGISLLGNPDYIDSNQNKIWDSKKNENFKNRVTGIGRDNDTGLLQKQSGNAEKSGLYIGYGTIDTINASNKINIADKCFLVWGDNGGSTSLQSDKNESNLKKMKRVWKAQNTGQQLDSVFTTVLLNTKEMQLEKLVENKSNDEEYIWLAISSEASENFDYTKASYFLPTSENKENLYFKSISWNNEESPFTFIKAPSFFVTHAITSPNCNFSENGSINVKINGGQAPFSITLKSKSYSKSFLTNENAFKLSDLPIGNYQLSVTDNKNKTQIDLIEIESIATTDLSIASEWHLDENGEAELIPIASSEHTISYEWYLNNFLLSKEKKFTAIEAGEYLLKAKNNEGCIKEFTVKVNSSQDLAKENWVLFPNPVKTDQPFTLGFNFEEKSDAEISIFDFGGKLLRTKNLYSIKDLDYRDSLPLAGSYLILVKMQGKTQAIKLIVR